ncbi:uncharacterized protein Dwil_GK27330 [Drosophila willistoni]|uniref:CHK kinase-like domain-containing protein n=2 Tax=Drosophila willistoni TaxID=7260 RepID=A0A0Q9X4C8_DROWI|nr:uncharacterized protein Dwil_GK27330 [Drosophila willistoni]
MEDPCMDSMPYFIKMLEDYPQLTKYKPYFENIRKTYLTRCRDAFVEYRENPQENFYYVLCHGDLFRRNMMFKHQAETGELEDCLLLDFQMSNVGPMPNDIIYALYQLFSPDQRINHRDELIEYYFAENIKTLKKIGYTGELPKLTVFKEHLFRLRYMEIFLLISFLPLIYGLKKQQAVDAPSWRDSEDLRHSFYHNDDYAKEVEQRLQYFVNKGYFQE